MSGRICLPVLITALACCLQAQAPDESAYRTRVQPFLEKHCLGCHNDKVKVADLSLAGSSLSDPVWDKVHDKLVTGRMPPLGSPQPPKDEVARIAEWIEQRQGRTQAVVEPGRVTSRRLNRAEYNNTVRDLLGVTLRPADEFPLDDAGYGFDTIGDVLSVSPMLMEKYIAAARKLSHAAVYGEKASAKPTKLVRLMTKKSQDDPTPGALPFSNRGALYGSFQFPVTGEYELRMRIGNYRPRINQTQRHTALSRKRNRTPAEQQELDELNRKAYPPVEMVLTFDGKPVLSEIVEGNIDFQYAHGESVARVRATAGEHFFRASFPEYAALDDPLDNMNLDGRRKMFIDYLDIVGPFNPEPGPPPGYERIFVCADPTPACAEQIIGNLARRAYRRPVAAKELAALTRLAAKVRDSGDSFEESIRVALQAILLSPNFLFRPEPVAPEPQPVSQFELASRLSYFLWSSMPDDELFRAAEAGRLRDTAVLRAQVRRMLQDPKADALVENFAGQWLGLRLMDRRKPDPGRFPHVDDELLESMRRETILFTRAIIQEDRSVLDFLDGRFTFVNGPLAKHYGIPGVEGESFQRVAFPDGRRGGVVTHGSVLTLSSYATRTSPVLRGHWVLENLLGTPPPPAPPDVPSLEEENLGKSASLRERLEQHRANPSCAVCHNLMDPIGFGLENFDAAGAWREKDGAFRIDASGVFPGGGEFQGPEQLRQALGEQSALFVRNLTEKMATYALGRGLESSDRLAVDEIIGKLKQSGYRMSALIDGIVESPPFRMRGKSPEGDKRNGEKIATR